MKTNPNVELKKLQQQNILLEKENRLLKKQFTAVEAQNRILRKTVYQLREAEESRSASAS